MRRALAWTAGIVGIAALARLLRRRTAAPSAQPEPATDPAEELRRVLDDTRATEEVVLPAAPELSERASLEERRADVHARAESAIARMRQGDG